MGKLSAVAVKMRGGIHPKHLIERDVWYRNYVKPTDVVVDLGCGVCRDSIGNYIGFDRDDSHGFYTDLEWCVPLPDGCADKVFMFNILEHVENRDFLLRNAYRILKPEGMLLLSVPNANTSQKRAREFFGFDGVADSDHKIEYGSLSEICNELISHGFGVVYSEPIVIDTFWAGMIDLIGGFHLGMYAWLSRWKRMKVFDNPQETTGWRIICKKTFMCRNSSKAQKKR